MLSAKFQTEELRRETNIAEDTGSNVLDSKVWVPLLDVDVDLRGITDVSVAEVYVLANDLLSSFSFDLVLDGNDLREVLVISRR
jgi:hypothetical protein